MDSDSVKSEDWHGIIGGPVGKAVAEAVRIVEQERSEVSPMRQDTFGLNGGDERCGVLYWWPVAVERGGGAGGRLICELRTAELENVALNAAAAFEISGREGGRILAEVSDQLVELNAVGLPFPQIFFGTWHTHPRGSNEVSAQDFTGEFEFEKWRESLGQFALGNPRSFVLVMDADDSGRVGNGSVRSVVAYDKVGLVSEWTRQN